MEAEEDMNAKYPHLFMPNDDERVNGNDLFLFHDFFSVPNLNDDKVLEFDR